MALTLLRLAHDRPGAEHTARLQAQTGHSAAHARAVERAGNLFALAGALPDTLARPTDRWRSYASGIRVQCRLAYINKYQTNQASRLREVLKSRPAAGLLPGGRIRAFGFQVV